MDVEFNPASHDSPQSKLSLECLTPNEFAARGNQSVAIMKTLAPRITGVADAPLAFSGTESITGKIAGIEGSIIRQSAEFGGCGIHREIFHSADRSMIAVRLIVQNASADAIELQSIVPIFIEGPAALRVAESGLDQWRIVRAGRQKNDVPGNFRFPTEDIDFEHAKIDAAEFKAGSGVQASDLAKSKGEPNTVMADPYLWIKHRIDETAPGLLLLVSTCRNVTHDATKMLLQ